MYQFQINSVRPAPAGFKENVVGLIDFTYVPSELDPPMVVTRWSKTKEQEYDGLTITGARIVRVHDAQIIAYKDGHFISVQSLKIPRPLSEAVTAEALKQLAGKEARPAVNPPAQQGDSYGIGSQKFQQGPSR